MLYNEADTRANLIDPKLNMAGWTRSQVTREHYYRPYPYDPADGREGLDAEGERVVRGGAYSAVPLLARSAWRNGVRPDLRAANIGVRVACDAK